jgi:hypothetical protein
MSDIKGLLLKLEDNLHLLQERAVGYGGRAPLELINQIRDHEKAIELTEQAISGEATKAEWEKGLKSLNIDQTLLVGLYRLANGFRLARGWLTIVGAYVAALAALFFASTMLSEPVEQLFPETPDWLSLTVASLPLATAIVTHGIPAWLRQRRTRKLLDWGLMGTKVAPGYFRVTPYNEDYSISPTPVQVQLRFYVNGELKANMRSVVASVKEWDEDVIGRDSICVWSLNRRADCRLHGYPLSAARPGDFAPQSSCFRRHLISYERVSDNENRPDSAFVNCAHHCSFGPSCPMV